MTPDGLRCESRRGGGGDMGLWRYSMAALIVIAALIDVMWWVPAHHSDDHRASDAPVSAQTPRCRK